MNNHDMKTLNCILAGLFIVLTLMYCDERGEQPRGCDAQHHTGSTH